MCPAFGSSTPIVGPISISPTVFSRTRSSSTPVATRTFLSGDDCCGEPGEENESFLFRLGVLASSAKGFLGAPWCPSIDALVNAGPRRFRVGELISPNACRFVLTLLVLFAALRADRGVKNLLNERGVTGGGLLGLRRVPASETTDGGEDGIS